MRILDTNGRDVKETVLERLGDAVVAFDEALDRWAETQETLGGYLAVIREERGVSMCKQARAMGISQPYLSMLEHGKRAWNPELVAKFVSALAQEN